MSNSTDTSDEPRENEVFIDDTGLLRCIQHGYLNLTSGMRMYRDLMACAKQLQAHKKSVKVLADTRDMTGHSEESIKSGIAIREDVPFKKMAILLPEANQEIKRVSEILTSGFEKKHIQYFQSESEAIKWLQA